MARTRVTTEIHDSVGHNLTAIIALSQGLAGTPENPELDESLEDIEPLAREGLDEIRRAVSLLGRLEDPVVVTEISRRPDGTPVADLAFSIVREALTNAVRRTEPLERASIAIDHHTTKGTRITIRSHGHSRKADECEPGNGLQRLSHRVTSQGGTFNAGSGEPDEWIVDAKLPPAPNEENHHA
nr:histidine kinase [Brevibacterium mcbrellneri]